MGGQLLPITPSYNKLKEEGFWPIDTIKWILRFFVRIGPESKANGESIRENLNYGENIVHVTLKIIRIMDVFQL